VSRGNRDRSGLLSSSVLLSALVLVALLLAGCEDEPGVPTYRLERTDFAHRITADGVLEAKKTTRLSVPSEVRGSVRLAWIAPEGTLLEEGSLVARFDPVELEKRLADSESRLAQVRHEIDRKKLEGERSLENVDKTRRLADLDLEHAQRFQRKDAEVFARREILEDAIDQQLAAERRENAIASLATEERLQGTELDLANIRARQAQMEIDMAESGLRALELRAPHGGILVYARNWRGEPPGIGQDYYRGQQLGEIPDLEELNAQVYVLEVDAGGLEEGLPVEVIVEARPGEPIVGEVSRVEPVAKPRLQGSPVRYFGVGVGLEGVDPDVLGLRPGQRVRATIAVQELEDVLVVPRQAIFEGAQGESRVWVREGDDFRSVAVELGAANAGLVVVEAGLEEGVEVALAEPERAIEE
jgi:multidrug efflux pump subunit AcrA (membrane-fusion protein)